MFTTLTVVLTALPVPIPNLSTEDWGSTLLLVLVAGLSILFTYLGVTRKARSRERVVEVETQAATTQAGLEVLIENLTSRLTRVEDELRELRGANRTLEVANHQLTSSLQTKDDVIEAFASVLSAWEDWFRSGSPDPPGPPSYTWQVRLHMRELSTAVKQSTEASQKIQDDLEPP